MRIQPGLSPVQQSAAAALLEGLSVGGVLALLGEAGTGKTTILRHLHALRGGAFVVVREFAQGLRAIEDALHAHDLLLVDDLHLVTYIVGRHNDPRLYLIDAELTALLAESAALRKTILFTCRGKLPWPVARRAHTFEIG